MDKNFKDIFNSSNIEPPKGLKQAVFERIEKEKAKKVARKRLFIKIGFAVSGISSVATVAIFGKEILSSEFFSLAALSFSDIKTVIAMWQDYAYSLMETLPTATIAMTLLPIFVFMELLRQYGKLENSKMGIAHVSSRT
jgi:ABC-type phosphate/phosphonate transport system permease subunit